MSGQRARRWGWHQLDDKWAERVVAEAGVRPGELVLDVGAGTGALTGPLVDAGARVIAIELHPARLDALRRRFGDGGGGGTGSARGAAGRVKVVKADAGSLRLPRRPFRVVANPPFAVTSPLLRRLLAPGSRLVAADLVLPRPAVQRWASGRAPGAGRWRSSHHVGVGARLPRSAFAPPAPVDCQTLVIRRR